MRGLEQLAARDPCAFCLRARFDGGFHRKDGLLLQLLQHAPSQTRHAMDKNTAGPGLLAPVISAKVVCWRNRLPGGLEEWQYSSAGAAADKHGEAPRSCA